MKNPHRKMAPLESPHEVWIGHGHSAGWTWKVLKKHQNDDGRPYARWLCYVTSPQCPDGEAGDCYVTDVTNNATLSHFQA